MLGEFLVSRRHCRLRAETFRVVLVLKIQPVSIGEEVHIVPQHDVLGEDMAIRPSSPPEASQWLDLPFAEQGGREVPAWVLQGVMAIYNGAVRRIIVLVIIQDDDLALANRFPAQPTEEHPPGEPTAQTHVTPHVPGHSISLRKKRTRSDDVSDKSIIK